MKLKYIYLTTILLFISLFTICFFNYEETVTTSLINNSYSKNNNYKYLSLTNDFIVKDNNHLLNVLYTIINSSNVNATFYCSTNYSNCLNDFYKITNDKDILSSINNFVHPYNSINSLSYSVLDNQINLTLNKRYNENDINLLNNKVNYIIKTNITNDMNDRKKIEVIHDYIINNSYYKKENDNEDFSKANYILLNGYGICYSYTDAMALFLSYLNIDNYKIASSDHIWNLVKLNNSWYHLDLTYDDPITLNNTNVLLKDAFLITTSSLENLNSNNHNFNKNIYQEAK